MVLLLSKMVYYDNLNLDPVSGVGIELTDATEIIIDLGLTMRNNSLRIKLKNDPINVFSDGTLRHRWILADGNPIFKAVKTTKGSVIDEEIIDVYARHELLDPTINVQNDNYHLFTGVINKGAVPFHDDSNAVELNCRDRSSIVLDKLTIPQSYKPNGTDAPDGIGWRSPFVIQNLARNATEYDHNARKFDNNGNVSLNGMFLVDARLFSDGIVDSGTTTSASTRKLIDSSQNFSGTVDKGDWVRNTTDDTYAYVMSVDSSTQLTLSKDLMASGEGYQIRDGFIQDKRNDGTSFPVISFSQINKPVLEGFEALSSTENTNSQIELDGTLIMKRSMQFFIDRKNRLHWYYPSDTPELIMKVGTTAAQSPDTSEHRIYGVDLETSVEGNINFIIYKAGEDMNNIQIKNHVRAAFSGTPNTKDSLRDWSHITRQMKLEDVYAGNITHSKSDEFNYPSSYPVTPAWDSQARSVSTDATYNTNFKEEANKRAKARARAIFAKVANPRWKGALQIRGEDIRPGDLIDFTSKAHGISDILVRVQHVTHSITALTGWISTVRVEEDESEIERI